MQPSGRGVLVAAALTVALLALLVSGAAARTSTGATIDHADHPAWSPDSRLIAFVYSRDHLSERRVEEIDTVDPATRRRRVVVAPFAPGTELYGLDWSAEGGLLFSSCCPGGVWLSRLDGAPPRLLVAGARDAMWSPDDGELAFIADEQLQVMRLDGSSRRVLAPSRGHQRITDGGRLSWSPDEGSIAYIDNGDLYVYSFAGQRSIRLTSTGGWENNPAWAPDGSLIAYASGSDLFVVRPDGRGRALLYDDPEDEGVQTGRPGLPTVEKSRSAATASGSSVETGVAVAPSPAASSPTRMRTASAGHPTGGGSRMSRRESAPGLSRALSP